MKRRAFLKSLAASVAGLFCANVAAKKPEPEKFVGTIMVDEAAEYHDDRYWVRGFMSRNEIRKIEAQWEAWEAHKRSKGL